MGRTMYNNLVGSGEWPSKIAPQEDDAEFAYFLKAAAEGDNKTVEAFLRRHPQRIDEMNDNHETALVRAAKNDRIDTMELLLQRGAQINRVTVNHWTAVSYAAHDNKMAALDFLLKRGANIEDDNPALIVATLHRDEEIVLRLQQEIHLRQRVAAEISGGIQQDIKVEKKLELKRR